VRQYVGAVGQARKMTSAAAPTTAAPIIAAA
jgi:hypothetical protein